MKPITSILIWTRSRLALPAATATLCLNALVLVILLVFYGEVVAPDSIRAMTFRIMVWIIILGLMIAQSRGRKATARGAG